MKLKKLIAILICSVLVFALAGISMAETEVTSTDKITLTVASFAGDGDTAAQFISNACDRITERTNGNVTFTKFLNGELGGPPDMFEMVRNGTVDMLHLASAMVPKDEFPVSQIITMPFYINNAQDASDVLDALREAGFLTEYDGVLKLLYLNGIDGDYLMTTTKKIESVADVNGVSIRAQGGGVDTVKALGGSPETVASSELYGALEKKVIDGAITGPTNMFNTKLYETCSYLLNYPICGGSQFSVMNATKWETLPDDYKAVFEEEMAVAQQEANAWMMNKKDEVIAAMAEAGMEPVEMTEENLTEFQAATASVIDDYKVWLNEEKGYDADAIFEIADGIINK